MKKSRFTEEQIAFAIKQHELGTRTEEICRKMGILDATFYKWRPKSAGLGPSELRKLKQSHSRNYPNACALR
jgi:putative transposase